ncbi:MAG: tetratricopeptide repeat protein [Steroidobacter sp.]
MSKHDALLAKAISAHQAGRLNEAAADYQRVLRRRPGDPDALHFFGLLQFHQRKSDKAVELITRSLTIAPGNPHAWNNLGNILSTQDKATDAKDAYRRVTSLAPSMPEAWFNLGICLRDEGQFDEAAEHFRQAIDAQPDFLRAYEALGMLHYRLGQFQSAAEIYQRWSDRDPANPVARHMAAAATGLNAPARAADEYVATLFDKYASAFDENLKALGYRAPELVATAVAQQISRPDGSLAILDAGCGTGLCGPLLRPFFRTLTGVDLSARMIDHARERGGYNELAVGELCAFMRGRERSFDVIVSADTLVYFGALEGVCAAANRSLRRDGLLVFTVEALLNGSPPYQLQVHGRYAHRETYIRETLLRSGFEILQISRETLRMERMQEVAGYLAVARRSEGLTVDR